MQKKIINISHPRDHHWVGDGFRVSQYIPDYEKSMSDETSPFLMLDYNSPYTMEPRTDGHRPGVGFHPHRGFETVTIVYSGEVEHQDTAGNGGIIGPGEVQWMTAGSGLLHNEFMTEKFSRVGGTQHMVQLWVDLPREYKMTAPRYQALTKENIPEVEFDGGVLRVIAGELKMNYSRHSEGKGESEGSEERGHPGVRRIHVSGTLDPSYRQDDEILVHEQKGVAKTFSPVELYDVRFSGSNSSLIKGVRGISLTFPEGYNAMTLVIEGSVIANEKSLENGDMLYLSPKGTEISLSTSDNAKVLIMAGKPLEQTVVAHGPFVMNTEGEIEEAFRDFRSGKMG